MLYYDRIDLSKRIDHTKRNSSKECKICHYLIFNHGFKFYDSVHNGCHDYKILCLNVSDDDITSVKNVIIAGLFIS